MPSGGPWAAATDPPACLTERHVLALTGSGKTIVMGMLIAWSLLNKARQPTDRRFSDAVLVVCPNLTVRERLRVLRPAEPDNLYEDFDLVPPGTAAARRRGVVKRGRESAGAFASRVLRSELGTKGNLLVINDEAHLSGSGHAEGEPFGWIVSDFSLGAPLEVQRWRSPELMLR